MDQKIDWDNVPDDEIHETLVERIVGLSEFCPDVVNKAVSKAFNTTRSLVKGAFYYGSNGIWILTTSFVIVALPFAVVKELHELEKSEVFIIHFILY